MTESTDALLSEPCALCGSHDLTVLGACRDRRMGTGYEGYLVACRACELVATRPAPSAAELAAFYPDAYPAHTRDRDRPGWGGRLRRLAANLPARGRALRFVPALYNLFAYRSIPFDREPGRLLDVGCGVGDYLADMAAIGWQGQGVELAPRAVARAQARGLDVLEGTIFDTRLDSHRFDLVTLWQVLEHLPEPVAALERARSLLAPDGVLALGVPNWASLWRQVGGDAWWCLEVPRHLYHFNARALRGALEAAGFEVLSLGGKVKASMIRGTLELMAGRELPSRARRVVELGLTPLDTALALAGRGNVLWALARGARDGPVSARDA